ncbi:hypothetical protein BU15DRAFT_64568 [Melanogaster broomeanus]|nr:hypothetical protein BU15DRAFT_64568 [Melanogaster broomeanus]
MERSTDHLSGSRASVVRLQTLLFTPVCTPRLLDPRVRRTAIATVLAGLRTPGAAAASIIRPTAECTEDGNRSRPGIFVVPQRAYMVSGSLLEQVIYPNTLAEFGSLYEGEEEEGLGDLQGILAAANLGYLVERSGMRDCGGVGGCVEWGETQRDKVYPISDRDANCRWTFRACYPRAKFAVLDVKFLPVGDGTGSWTFTPISTSATPVTTGSKEGDRVLGPETSRGGLSEAEGWAERVRELEEGLKTQHN